MAEGMAMCTEMKMGELNLVLHTYGIRVACLQCVSFLLESLLQICLIGMKLVVDFIITGTKSTFKMW